ncbi:MAG: hypothetical protein Q8873_00155 [Bacillota bacterium]|nr:hypothetical protein [Bacillota bacterium]
MRIEQLGKLSPIAVPGAIFASANKDTFIELSNYQQITFLIESGEGTAGSTTITVEAKAGASGTAVAIPFMYMEKGDANYVEKAATGAAFGIGGASGASKYAVITVTSPMLANGEYDRVAIKTTAVTSSTVPGAIYAIQSQPRYSV